jgi:dTDP-4-dehydrorhamnose reductase
MATKTILVTGSNGQLGSELKDLAPQYPQYKFCFFSRSELAIDNAEEVERAFALLNPHYVINAAAYTAVDKAETEKDEALAVNAKAPGLLAKAAKKFGAKFIHISTDYVFDGESEVPLTEGHPVSPVNFYGETKLKGEQNAIAENPETVIIRTAWVYSVYGKNFVKTMLRLMAEKESISVVADQVGSPTYAADLAAAILQIIEHGKWHCGIYHYSNEGVISWAEFAAEIGRQINSSCKVAFITTDQYPTPAKRPRYSVLDKSKIKANYGVTISPWQRSLQTCLQKLLSSENVG